MNGIQLRSVSIGKGIVHWRVEYPTMAKKNRNLRREYENLDEACAEMKRFLRKDQLDPATAKIVEDRAPEGAWGERAEAAAPR